MNFENLKGMILTRVEQVGDDRIEFDASTGEKFVLFHSQDCCECVVVEDVCGDFADLIGTPILLAEEVEHENNFVPEGCESYDASDTWTFYKLRTIKGSVDIRWHGSSNGYYSESVDFEKL